MGAKSIAETADVTLRFSLKILRKLVASGIIRSYKGAQGGYEIARDLDNITLNDILETIEGPFVLNRCLYSGYECAHQMKTGTPCPYHAFFASISDDVRSKLSSITISSVLSDSK